MSLKGLLRSLLSALQRETRHGAAGDISEEAGYLRPTAAMRFWGKGGVPIIKIEIYDGICH